MCLVCCVWGWVVTVLVAAQKFRGSRVAKIPFRGTLTERRYCDRVTAWLQRQRDTGQVGKWVILTGFVAFNLGYGFYLVGYWSNLVGTLQAAVKLCQQDRVMQ